MQRLTHERKFVAEINREIFGLAWLRHVCLPDPTFPEARVHSVYYDTPSLDCYSEKVNGDLLKTKVRLRWYDPDISQDKRMCTVFLEIKNKVGAGRRKVRMKLELERQWLDGADLDDVGFMHLLREYHPHLEEWVPAGLTPVLLVGYRRHRFVCPATGAGVCLDASIDIEKVNDRLIPLCGCVNIPVVVVEIKDTGRTEIPWLEKLFSAGFRSRSFSKYAECMAQLLGEESL